MDKQSLTQKELDEYYSAIYNCIKENSNMSDTAFNLWFNDLHLVSITDEKIILATSNVMQRSMLTKHYKDLIINSVYEALGYEPKVDIICDNIGEKYNISSDKEINVTKGKIKTEEVFTESNIFESIGLNEEFTFENFVVGSSNQQAHTFSTGLAENPDGSDYSPLFIHGPSGLGKTHLMYAIANKVHEKFPEKFIVCINSNVFLQEIVDHLTINKLNELKRKYKQADMLLIDDIQVIGGKTKFQEMFFEIFNALYESKKQIVLTSDRPPKEMHTLEERIKTRMTQGVLVDVKPPEYELRLAIIKKKAEKTNMNIPNEVIIFLAEKLNSNIREIEGALKKIGGVALLQGKEITLELVKSTIPDYFRENKPVAETVNAILEITARKYDVTVENILGKSRTKNIKTARNVSMYIVKKVLDLSLNDIGKMYDRDHATVHSNIKAIETEIKSNDKLNNEIQEIMMEIKS